MQTTVVFTSSTGFVREPLFFLKNENPLSSLLLQKIVKKSFFFFGKQGFVCKNKGINIAAKTLFLNKILNFKVFNSLFTSLQNEWKPFYNVFFKVFKMMNICEEYHMKKGVRQGV